VLVVDPQHPTVDVDATPHLVELPKAHNADLCEIKYTLVSVWCPPSLQVRMMEPRPSILVMEPSPNLTVQQILESGSAKMSHDPVMWLVAPVSRTQRLWSFSSVRPRSVKTYCSSMWMMR
jgi:hypothetical protein